SHRRSQRGAGDRESRTYTIWCHEWSKWSRLMDVRHEIMQLAQAHLSRVRHSGPDNITAVCPYHMKADGSRERNPSFAMNINTGLYFCHTCGAKGNLYTFLKDLGLDKYSIQTGYQQLVDAAKSNLPPPPDPINARLVSNNPIEPALLGLFDYCPK